MTDTTAPLSARLRDAMQDAWNDFCSDTGHHPDCFSRKGASLYADFNVGNFAEMVSTRLECALSARVAELEAERDACAKEVRRQADLKWGERSRATQAEAERDALWEALDNVIGYASNYLDQHLMVNADKDADIIRARAALANTKGAS